MAKLMFEMMASLDGYTSSPDDNFDWGGVDDTVHQHANDEQRQISLDIYGRRMYEMMVYWETYDGDEPVAADFADAWRATEKIAVSKSLGSVSSARTTLLADLDVEGMRKLKAERDGTISISGATIAARFLDAGLVDEVGIYYIPVVVGGGTAMFQGKNKLRLERVEERSFGNGVNFMRYRVLN
jgi:dihydrofolate reductase